MRIVAGEYRGRVLKSPPSMQVRPTSDRLRETLFNVLAPRIQDAKFLDLCAGSGAIGIEAISRGAGQVTFVDKSRKLCGLIEANLDLVGAPEDQTEVVMSEAADYVRKAAQRGESWDIVFFDPPYSLDYAPVLKGIGNGTVLNEGGVLIAEHHHKTALPEEIGNLRRWRILRQGDSSLSFYEAV
jgi:16S rRNA (guanine(966)-N(2))-methyltransferase RsmD